MAEPQTVAAEAENGPKFAVGDTFDPKLISSLPGLSSDHLSQLEEMLSSEFSSLARQYLEARAVRVDQMLAAIDTQIKNCQQSDRQWSDKYAAEMELISRLGTHTESQILAGNKKSSPTSMQAFDLEIDDLMAHLVLPTVIDDLFSGRGDQLPFAPQFHRIIQQYRAQLDALANQKTYQTELVEENVEKTKTLLWKQYKLDASEYRQKLIDDTYLELNELYQEYYGIKDNSVATTDAASYYRSLVSVEDMRRENDENQHQFAVTNIDSYYDIDDRYYKNNRVQITDAKRAALDRLHTFHAQQTNYSIPQVEEATVHLSGLQGLTQEETDSDLLLLRSTSTKVAEDKPKSGSISTSPNPASEFQAVLDTDRAPSQVEMKPLRF